MTLNELLEKVDLIETEVTVYRNGEKFEINWMSDSDYQVTRIYCDEPYQIKVEIEG